MDPLVYSPRTTVSFFFFCNGCLVKEHIGGGELHSCSAISTRNIVGVRVSVYGGVKDAAVWIKAEMVCFFPN